MATLYDVSQGELVSNAAEELKKVSQIKPPVWANFAKTGVSRERPPVRQDWWYTRAASILKNIYKLGPIGTSKLRIKYGGRKNRGHAPEHTYKGSGSVVRKLLQQLDAAGLTRQVEKGRRKGRTITPKGRSFLDKIATQILSRSPRVASERQPAAEEQKPKKAARKESKAKAQEKPAE
jgi:small subunit ribosomal protein S19e